LNILLIGSGGREHALAWRLAQSSSVKKFYAAPGNPGIAHRAKLVQLDTSDHDAVIRFCQMKSINLVVVGPEAPLVDGLGDSLREADILVFGPNKAAAQLEGSKGFTKDLCKRANIPTAGYVRTCNAKDALTALNDFSIPVVIKADGLAAGKGVIIAETEDQAVAAIQDMFDGSFGDAGAEVVIEEFLEGEEASFFAITDGENIVPFGTAQDHKRVGEGDVGPNTGGMGAYSPAPILTKTLRQRVMDEIIRPTVSTLAAEGTPYSGVLFAGLMLTESGPQLIEYNARFGDPECQVLMMRLKSDLAKLMMAAARGDLSQTSAPTFDDQTALTVVMAANGYPGTAEKGGKIQNLRDAEKCGARIFQAGTAIVEGKLVASGGRVLNVTSLGDNTTDAQVIAYEAVDTISFETGFCRRDIGWREVERESGN